MSNYNTTDLPRRGLGYGGAARTREHPTQKIPARSKPAESPSQINKDEFLRGYPIGKLIFWDRNGDGRFRWIHGDYITHVTGTRIRAGNKLIRETLQPRGIKWAYQLKNLPAFQNPLHRPTKKKPVPELEREQEELKDVQAQAIETQMLNVEIAMEMGDYGSFSRELVKLKELLQPMGISLPQHLIEKMETTTHMNYHFRETAALLDQGHVEWAADQLQRALKHAEKLGLQLDTREISIAIRSVPPFEISEDQIKDLFRLLETGLGEKVE